MFAAKLSGQGSFCLWSQVGRTSEIDYGLERLFYTKKEKKKIYTHRHTHIYKLAKVARIEIKTRLTFPSPTVPPGEFGTCESCREGIH